MHSSLLSCNYNVRPNLSHTETIIETVGPKLVPVANFNLYVIGQKYQYFGKFHCFYKFSNVESSNRITYFTNRYSFTCFETFQNTTAENRTIIEPPPYYPSIQHWKKILFLETFTLVKMLTAEVKMAEEKVAEKNRAEWSNGRMT